MEGGGSGGQGEWWSVGRERWSVGGEGDMGSNEGGEGVVESKGGGSGRE